MIGSELNCTPENGGGGGVKRGENGPIVWYLICT